MILLLLITQFQSTRVLFPLGTTQCTMRWHNKREKKSSDSSRANTSPHSPGNLFFLNTLMSKALVRFPKPMGNYRRLVWNIRRFECFAVSFMCEQWWHREKAVGEQWGLLLKPQFSRIERWELGHAWPSLQTELHIMLILQASPCCAIRDSTAHMDKCYQAFGFQ